ncbi:MAG: ubiquitin-conjugating enzyme E2 [Planctomycetota bacterium]|nr:ubiquitin-conjugating enzyme E2 [Planctomycetota bacterium]
MTHSRRRSPRERRLHSDLDALQQLSRESSIFDFDALGSPPEQYRIFFRGRGLWKPVDSSEVLYQDNHELIINLTSAYPRMIPELAWQTPIFHPNISASGVVCLGGYGTHWVPSLMLDELCHMLWDMIRYRNFDIESPYNREAAMWTKQQGAFQFPLDHRPLRDRMNQPESQGLGALPVPGQSSPGVEFLDTAKGDASRSSGQQNGENDILFIE